MFKSSQWMYENGGGYTVGNSLRFRSSASAYLSRTPASASDQKKWTFSAWVKRGQLGATQIIAQAGTGGTTFTYIAYFNSSDQLVVLDSTVGGVSSARTTSAVFRDPSAWYHIVVYLDAANSTSKVYVNNVEQTCTGTQPSNQNWAVNSAIEHRIGRAWATNTSYLDGYLTEVNFIDGQALTPDSFGEYNDDGIWIPKAYEGTYGTNGFYLNFSDSAAVGTDTSGNGNNWTPNNIQTTDDTLTTYDWVFDSPTNSGEDVGNYAVLNPLDRSNGSNVPTMSNGNLSAASPANPTHFWGTIALPVGGTGGWYWEGVCTSMDTARTYIGIIDPITSGSSPNASYAFVDKAILTRDGTYYNTSNGTAAASNSGVFTSYAQDDTVMVAYKDGKIWFGKNGTWMNSGDPAAGTGAVDSSVSTTKQWIPYFGYNSSWTVNFGQRPFKYTPPAGFKKLHTGNLSTPTVTSGDDYFKTYTYTGNGGGLQVGEVQKPYTTYEVEHSLRFRSSASAYLNRTFSTPTNNKIWTWSAWIKRGAFPASTTGLFGAGTSGTNYCYLGFQSGSTLNFQNNASSGNQINATTTAVFRDPSAWYHIVLAVDTTQATNSNGVRIWINGVQQTLTFSTYTQNTNTLINAASGVHVQGDYINGGGLYFDGYLTEINFIDGQALTASDFGEFDGNNYWVPKAYTGTFGTNGFYLDFNDNTNIGNDVAGSNDWTANNFQLTDSTLSTYDWMIDVPTLYDDGGNGRGNYFTLNPIDVSPTEYSGIATITNGNLTVTGSNQFARGWQIPSSGQWYWEITLVDFYAGSPPDIWGGHGISSGLYTNLTGVSLWADSTGGIVQDGTKVQTFSTWANNDVIGFAYDSGTRSMSVYRNGTQLGTSVTANATDKYIYSYLNGTADTSSVAYNFGQRPFAYTPPTGFKALNTYNIAEVTTDLESPDLVWIKSRSTATNHALFDSVRGVKKYVSSSTSTAETTDENSLLQFNKNGFLLGSSTAVNTSGTTYAAWGWKAGTSAVTNNDGTIESQVRVNPTAGFSIVSYTGNGTAGATVGHGLGFAPSMIIVKNRTTSSTNWPVWHTSLTNETFALYLDTTLAQGSANNPWGSGTINSTTFHITATGTANSNQNTANYVAYCFAEVPGYSKFGSYTGNGSTDGPFVYCGFRPRFIMWKRTDSTGDWSIMDTGRWIYNGAYADLNPNNSDAEAADSYNFDILSNGFKIRQTYTAQNASGGTYIFAAFAEHPFASNNRAR